MVSSFLIKQIISSESLCVKHLARRKIHHKANNQTVENREERVVTPGHYLGHQILLFSLLQVMVTEGPGGEETSVYDITMSEIQSGM